jgi:hypothetical protein
MSTSIGSLLTEHQHGIDNLTITNKNSLTTLHPAISMSASNTSPFAFFGGVSQIGVNGSVLTLPHTPNAETGLEIDLKDLFSGQTGGNVGPFTIQFDSVQAPAWGDVAFDDGGSGSNLNSAFDGTMTSWYTNGVNTTFSTKDIVTGKLIVPDSVASPAVTGVPEPAAPVRLLGVGAMGLVGLVWCGMRRRFAV